MPASAGNERTNTPPSDVKINVYNIAGELVRTLGPAIREGGTTYYDDWDCTNMTGRLVASGVYIGEISWKGKRKFIKMAIIKGSGL